MAWARAGEDQRHAAGVRFEVITDEQRAWLRQVLDRAEHARTTRGSTLSARARSTSPGHAVSRAPGSRSATRVAVERGADDAARVARAFAARVQAGERRRHSAPASRSKRTGALVRVSAATSTASGRRKARQARADLRAGPRAAPRSTNGGSTAAQIAGRAARAVAGSGRRCRWRGRRGNRRAAAPGAAKLPPPARNAACSIRRCSSTPASGPAAAGPKSAAATVTTRPAFANGESRRDRLMPLTTTPSASVAAGTIQPPGHMQKL